MARRVLLLSCTPSEPVQLMPLAAASALWGTGCGRCPCIRPRTNPIHGVHSQQAALLLHCTLAEDPGVHQPIVGVDGLESSPSGCGLAHWVPVTHHASRSKGSFGSPNHHPRLYCHPLWRQ